MMLSNKEIDCDELVKEVERQIKTMPEYGTQFILDGPVKCKPMRKRV
jgi:hypothetical protein